MSKRKNANGMGTTVKLDNGRYRHTITVEMNSKGKAVRKSACGKTKIEAIRNAEKKAEKYKQEKLLVKDEITFVQLATKAVDNMLRTGQIRESTYTRKMETLKRLAPLHDIPICAMTEDDLDEFFDSEIKAGISDSTMSKDIALIRATFELAVKRKTILSGENFTLNYRKPKSIQEKCPVRALTRDEQKLLIDKLNENNTPYKEVMLLIMYSGLRPGEALALNVDDIHLNERKLYITKTLSQDKDSNTVVIKSTKTKAGTRMVTLTAVAVELLKTVIGNRKTGLLFADDKGKPIPVGKVRYQLNKVIMKSRIADLSVEGKIDLHSLRHTYATRCFDAGINPVIVQKQLGHKNIQTTLNTYTSIFDEKLIEGMEELDDFLKNEGL